MSRTDEIRERLAKAKGPGPWESLVRVHAPADIAALLAEGEALRSENDILDAAVLLNQEGVRDLNNKVLELRGNLQMMTARASEQREGRLAALESLATANARVKALREAAIKVVHSAYVPIMGWTRPEWSTLDALASALAALDAPKEDGK